MNFILSKMDEQSEQDRSRWEPLNDSLDTLFERVGQIDANQQKADIHYEMTYKVFEQMLKDQQVMAKQLEATGHAVAQLTIA
jgi:hypothetical protein